MIFEPLAFIERLAALVPKPHKNLVIYSGVLAPNAKLRRKVVEYTEPNGVPSTESAGHAPATESTVATAAAPEAPGRRRPNYSWADLMRRAFAVDVLLCPHCGGRLALLAAFMSPPAIAAILASLGLPTEASEPRPARASPEPLDLRMAWRRVGAPSGLWCLEGRAQSAGSDRDHEKSNSRDV